MSFKIDGFHHFSLLTVDIDRSAAFYENVLGLKRKPRPAFSTRGLWYDVGDQELHLIESDSVPSRYEGHPALEVSDIESAVQACRSAGAVVQQEPLVRDHDGSYCAFVRDPDGNLLEFTQHGSLRQGESTSS